MSYFGFLALFLLIPMGLLAAVAVYDHRRQRQLDASLRSWPAIPAILLHALIALIYTTPWDNYLVATRVWWYAPELVTGITLGWVPIEEYSFFILQPILAGLWLLFLGRRMSENQNPSDRPLRRYALISGALLWLAAAAILAGSWLPGNYLALELVWALPPIMLQLGFGADILWRRRRLVVYSIASLTLYLSAADALAIGWGTWTINPAKSTGLLIGGILPVEELLFFLLTNSLLVFGVVLLLAKESHVRIAKLFPLSWSSQH